MTARPNGPEPTRADVRVAELRRLERSCDIMAEVCFWLAVFTIVSFLAAVAVAAQQARVAPRLASGGQAELFGGGGGG